MQRDLIVKGRSLGGSSDLTLLAPIRPGFIESLESVTYKTRIKRVLETLHGVRTASHEVAPARLLSDAVERVGVIQSVRVAVLEPENKVLLAVSFDGSWEAYIRVLWDKVGTLLDLIFCGTTGYVTAFDHRYEEWLVWARQVQVETGFFYGPAEITARDTLYQRRAEQLRLRCPADAPRALGMVLPGAEEAVQRLVDPPRPAALGEPPYQPVSAPRMTRERLRTGLQGLAAIYRLTDLHRPATPDGEVLRRAALDLLLEFVQIRDHRLIDKEIADERVRFARQIDWLFPADPAVPAKAHRPAGVRQTRALPQEDAYAVPTEVRQDVQGGVLRAYEGVDLGLLVLLAFDSAASAGAALAAIGQRPGGWTRDSDPPQAVAGRPLRNIAFTPAGLRRLGLDEDTLERFPEEFRQGMAARAGLLGDVRHNHPRRWHLPPRFTGLNPPGADAAEGPADPSDVIELDGVHAVLQLRARGAADLALHDPAHPLHDELQALHTSAGLRVLAVQPMRRRRQTDAAGQAVVAEHFGYADGQGQPELEWPAPAQAAPFHRNRVRLGEVLLGHPNAADGAPASDTAATPPPPAVAAERERAAWLHNGSFLVVRKYRQYVGRLQAAVEQTARDMAAALAGIEEAPPDGYAELVYAKLMGRRRDGQALIPTRPGKPNHFTYDRDPEGAQCPLHAHVRRAHPRSRPGEMARPPRLVRRGMSYGPDHAPDHGDEVDRGLVFMAYNASLGEQFEVVQRWLVGGNATGASSAISCPLLGVPDNGLPRIHPIDYQDGRGGHHVFHVRLDGDAPLFEEPPVITRLDWGLYLFAPSLSVLERLQALAQAGYGAKAGAGPGATAPWQTARGRQLLEALQALERTQGPAAAAEAWKAALEDPDAIDRLDAAALWAAIREHHGGLLRTPYGVLLASPELVAHAYRDPHGHYSVGGQLERMRHSFGEIALGMDDGPVYRRLAERINQAIADLTPAAALKAGRNPVYDLAYASAAHCLQDIAARARMQSRLVNDARFEVGFELREVMTEVLADLSEAWFGLDEAVGGQRHFERGSTDWAWQRDRPPLYPGHFTALSRYMFQPHPGAMATELGRSYGQALRFAMNRFVAAHRARGSLPRGKDGQSAPLARAIFTDPGYGQDQDFVARTLVGVLMGFNPTIIGAVLNVAHEWQRSGRFGSLRTALRAASGGRAAPYEIARQHLAPALREAAQMRPMPQLGWRTARQAHRLGGDGPHSLWIDAGEKIVLGIVSGTQAALAEGRKDGERLMFGGRREDRPDHPTHACPGYMAGIGAMLGSLAAVLNCPAHLRPGPAPLTFVMDGPVDLGPAPGMIAQAVRRLEAQAAEAARRAAELAAAQEAAGRLTATTARAAQRGLILAWGDSWLDFSFAKLVDIGTDLRDCLERRGWDVPPQFCKYSAWPRATTMAARTEAFCAELDAALLTPTPPVALLLSAGGNDSTGNALRALLRPKTPSAGQPTGPAAVLDAGAVTAHIQGIAASYRRILRAIQTVYQEHGLPPAPAIVHGYDHPIPRGHSELGLPYVREWLLKPFLDAGYDCERDPQDLALARAAMRELIDALNDMLGGLVGEFDFVHHVNLCGTIADAHPEDPGLGWYDDLHPTSPSFERLAERLHQAIDGLTGAHSASASAA